MTARPTISGSRRSPAFPWGAPPEDDPTARQGSIRRLLARHGLAPSRTRGQNFLRSPEITKRIVDVSGLAPEDAAIEVGAGLGDLTRVIAGVARRTVALEIDRGLVELLREAELPESVDLRHADVLRTDLGSIVQELAPPVVLLGNLPYRISGRFLAALLGPRNPFRRMALMLQAEVADRLLADPGTPAYGVLSVWASLWAHGERALELGPEAFDPRPRVRSTLLVFQPTAGPRVDDVPLLRQLVRRAFQHRRKTLRAALRGPYPSIAPAFEESGVDPSLRAGALAPQDFVDLANAMAGPGGPI